MQTLELANERAADLYWLAFLITGHRQHSLDVAIEAFELHDDANQFFSTWMLAWSRRVVIAKALAAIRGQLAISARWTESRRASKSKLQARNWVVDRHTTKVELERVLLAIDVFPRCALLLSIFEGMPVEDVALLLDADPQLVRKGQMTGLLELTRNLIRMQAQTSNAATEFVVWNEDEHAETDEAKTRSEAS